MDAYLRAPLVRQTWVTLSVLVNLVAQGMSVGYTSSLLAALQASNSPVKVDLHSASWLASSLGPAYLSGQLVSAILMDWLGRRRTLLLAAVPPMTGWILIYFGQSYELLLCGRILTGIGIGYIASFGAIVIGEYTSPRYRGIFLNMKMACYNLGSTIAHILDNHFDWRTIPLLALVPNLLSLLIICTLPESPAWLAAGKKFKKCREEFFWLRGRSGSAILEVEELITARKERLITNEKSKTKAEKLIEIFKKFIQKDFLRCLLVISFALLLLETAGRNYFSAYADRIMSDITGTKTDQHNYTLVLDLLITISSFVSVVLVKAMKRRTLLFASGISALVVLLPACICLYLLSNEILPRNYQLLPLGLLATYFVLINLGGTPITVALKGELFPLHHRSGGAIASAFINFLIITSLLHSTPYLLISVKVHGTFALFGAIMALALFVLYFTLPETKNRTLQEIEDYFQHGRFVAGRVQNEESHVTMVEQDINKKEEVTSGRIFLRTD